jgi:hypothetical protein
MSEEMRMKREEVMKTQRTLERVKQFVESYERELWSSGDGSANVREPKYLVHGLRVILEGQEEDYLRVANSIAIGLGLKPGTLLGR